MNNQSENSSKWYNKPVLVNVLLVLLFPVGLYALWKSDRIAKWWKITASVIIGLFLIGSLGNNKKNKPNQKSNIKDYNNSILENIKFRDENDRIRILYLDSLKDNSIYIDIVNQKNLSIQNLQFIYILCELQANLTANFNQKEDRIIYSTTLDESLHTISKSTTKSTKFFDWNYRLLENGGLPYPIILSMMSFANKYGYYGGNSIKYDDKGNEQSIDFKFCLIKSLINYAPKNEGLLDIFCEASQKGFVTLDEGNNYVSPLFRNKQSYNKMLKTVYPDCDCFIDYEKQKAEQEEEFSDDCMVGGFCDNLKHHVYTRLNDPSSFEHVKTTTYNEKDYVLVVMQYRTNNVYGGKVLKFIKAKVSWNCEILEIVDYD